MEILCESCQGKIKEKGFLVITAQKSFILCRYCGFCRNDLNFPAEAEIFQIKKVKKGVSSLEKGIEKPETIMSK